jgi:hypothetical protein
VRERPILFSGPMVRAILAGKKTQTRRVVRAQLEGEPQGAPYLDEVLGGWKVDCLDCVDPGCSAPGPDLCPPQYATVAHWFGPCPYGAPGDRLWVRETWASDQHQRVAFAADGWCGAHIGDGDGGVVHLQHGWILGKSSADGRYFGLGAYGGRWRPSIHMPRWASRIEPEVTGIRVERLQEITRDDAIAEGIPQTGGEAHALGLYDMHREPGHLWDNRTSVENYARLWDSLNAERAPWDSNPWVWVVEFSEASA